MLRLILATLLLIKSLAGASNAAAQTPAQPDTVLLDREFRDTLESARVFLFRTTVYQVETNRLDARPRFSPIRSGVYPPTALRIRDSGGSIGGPVYEVHVDRDGEYDVGVSGMAPGQTARLRLLTDNQTTANRQRKLDTPGWSLGLRAEIGRHSGYLTSATPDSPDGGMIYDGCLAISNGSWLSLCLGGGADARGGSDTRVAWIFAEIHAAVFTRNALGRAPTSLGGLVRVAQGGAGSDVSRDPSYYGAGAFVQQWIRHSPNGRGVSVLLSAQYGVIRNITIKGESTTLIKAGLQWLP